MRGRYNPGMQDMASMFRLDGRVAFVAGAASGIGLAAAQGLASAGAFHVLRAAGRHMQAHKGGSIILCSSMRAVTVEPGQSIYAATKAGLIQMARGLAVELGPVGVRVNCIAPGVVETPLTAPIKSKPEWYAAYSARNALNRWASAGEMAGPVVFLASDASSYVTGAVLFVDGGWTAIDGRFTPPV